MKTKIGTEVAHVTRDSDTTFKVKRSKVKVTRPLYSARPQRVRRLQRSAWERIRHGKVLLRCVCSAVREAPGRPRGEEGGGGISCRHAHSLFLYSSTIFQQTDIAAELKGSNSSEHKLRDRSAIHIDVISTTRTTSMRASCRRAADMICPRPSPPSVGAEAL